jgi:hypothetical protein
MIFSKTFIPGEEAIPSLPLERFMPPVRAGISEKWLSEHVDDGATILDPFGASPLVALEAARAGYRVIVAANNPIVRFLIEQLAQPATYEAMQAAMASLASIRRAEQRLEPHIRELYASICPNCGEQVSARAFIWDRETQVPTTKILDCKHCGNQDEHPVDELDIEKALSFERRGPHRARALERVAAQGAPLRRHVADALESYLPRAIYGFFTILNRLDRLQADENQRKLINALLLVALDRCNSIWEHPSGRPRPKQLVNPTVFREHNIWREIEDALQLWNGLDLGTELKQWPSTELEGGGIVLFPGSFRQLEPQLDGVEIAAVVSAIPRPNQAYWTLSALWTGWLWGQDSIGPFASVLKRRRYDWSWHTEALHATLKRVPNSLGVNKPIFGLIGEAEEGFLAACITAGNLASLKLDGLSMRSDWRELQLHWKVSETPEALAKDPSKQLIKISTQKFLHENSQPSAYLHIQASALAQLAQYPNMGQKVDEQTDLVAQIREEIESVVESEAGFLRLGSKSKAVEAGQWWLSDPTTKRTPLFDRIEIAFVRQLIRQGKQTLGEIDRALCTIFPGLITPNRDYLKILLHSYGQELKDDWQIKPDDLPRVRRADLEEMRSLLISIGEKIFGVERGAKSIDWIAENGERHYVFYPIASGIFSEIIFSAKKYSNAKQVILMPGSRSKLVLKKLDSDERLKLAAHNWIFLKYRHIRRLSQFETISESGLIEMLELDPISEDPIQAPLL